MGKLLLALLFITITIVKCEPEVVQKSDDATIPQPNPNQKLPTTDELLKMLDNMPDMSEKEKQEIRDELLGVKNKNKKSMNNNNNDEEDPEISATGTIVNSQIFILFGLISLVTSILGKHTFFFCLPKQKFYTLHNIIIK